MTPREWDARAYDALPLPHEEWGRRTLARLEPAGVRTVLDAGCGTGRDTALLLDLLPDARVVVLDASTAMLERLRVRLADRLGRVRVVHADLMRPLPLDAPVDAVTSVAAFHWVPDHRVLFRNLAAVLRPGGQLVTECGGAGNIAAVLEAIRAVDPSLPSPWNFQGTAETEAALREAGFTDIAVALVPDPARLEAGAQLREYLRAVVLGAHLDRLAEAQRPAFVEAVARGLSAPVIDYVRLQIRARLSHSQGSASSFGT